MQPTFQKRASDFAKIAGIPAIQTHCGFIPEDPVRPLYGEMISAMRQIGSHCRVKRQDFLCETGQETPVTMLRAVTDVLLDPVEMIIDHWNPAAGVTGSRRSVTGQNCARCMRRVPQEECPVARGWSSRRPTGLMKMRLAIVVIMTEAVRRDMH